MVVQPMSPKSPPGSLDLYGKRRQWVKLQVLEREIALLQEELKSIEGLQPASRSCKELDNFIGAKPDPFILITQEIPKSKPICKTLWARICLKFGRICCFSCSQCKVEMCNWCLPLNSKCWCCCKWTSVSCPHCGCCCLKSVFRKCTEVNCGKNCCKPCCL